jgi:glycosyltransferase involved in cell wall biosynthesis
MVPNGVDTRHNRLGIAAPEPNTLVYSGAITYHPNYDAVEYFLRAIFPLVNLEEGEAILRVTGGTGHTKVEPLARYGHVEFTGHLADIRPTVAGSWASVVPLRIGGGTRLKILESMALGTPVVSTSKGVEGLDVVPEQHLLIADSPGEFATQTVRLLRDPGLRDSLSTHARQHMEEQYDWTEIGRKFTDVVEQVMARGARSNCLTLAGLNEQAGNEV